MGNQTTTLFQTLKELPIPLSYSQCVLHKHELLICGGYDRRACYSYHTVKNEYKFICEYPSNVRLNGHCVVKLVDNNNSNNKHSSQITLLSFGSGGCSIKGHTLVMKYVSVWNNDDDNHNQWIPFTDNHNNPIIIAKDYNYYCGARAVISGSNNSLLFITYFENNISVFDLNTFQFIKHDTLPIHDWICYHCFVSNSENGQGQEIMMKTNKQNYQMLLFYKKTGLLIEYDEDNNTFQFFKLPVCEDIEQFYKYAYVCINNVILLLGGSNYNNSVVSKSVHKYSIRENKWMTFKNILPSSLFDCVAVLSEEDNNIHIIGGEDDKRIALSVHTKTKLRVWDFSYLSKNEIKFIIQHWIRGLKIKIGWIYDFDKIIMKYSRMK
ncbi:hypothetical protein RFI_04972 [Reticulomyxa filosa]|uniref:Kelch motif family protein n=1 Tax=Reticulomyxa filosa TaxID=46433 RepID=X6P1L9_RETFI|nr:hypothetical protein RFI_04972 [Reticulomyxa filosa]|eukprot:ETO32146.1 hypothetical protein RFI_04972 [Reticulomyxa filosa]